jgi:Xaa-Pro aminopeptidase
MRSPKLNMAIFQQRREQLAAEFKNSALIIPSHPEHIRNNDCHYPYRQDSNLYFLTGFEEPSSVFVFRPGNNPETVLFVQPKDIDLETWTGFRYGVDGARTHFKMDATYSIHDLNNKLKELLTDVDTAYCTLFIDREFDQTLLDIVEQIGLSRSRTNKGNLTVADPRAILGEARLRKSTYEIEAMRQAGKISSRAHVEVMKHVRPGVNERALHGVFLKSIMEQGCAREAYNGIFASGNNATTLHYVYNDQVLKDGEIFLVDAGGEYEYYAGDITRSYPVNGKFKTAQKRVYESMLELQKHLIQMVRPGITRNDIQKVAIEGITDLLIQEKVVRGSRAEVIEKKEYARFYPHGVGHWLGLDVHDAGLTELNKEPRPVQPGFVLTIEPGFYIPQDTPGVSDDIRGIGIRIEDDILVTETGHENLTAECPKEILDLEGLIGKG